MQLILTEMLTIDRDYLPESEEVPVHRPYSQNPDMDEVSRFQTADDDLAYLASTLSREESDNPNDILR